MCCTSYLQRKRVETQLKICKVCQIWQNCLSGKTRKLRRKISRIDSCPFLPTSVHFYLSDSQYRSQLQWTIRNEPLGVTSIISRVQFSCAFFNSDIFLSVYFYHLLWNALKEIIKIKHFDNIFPEDSITQKVPPDKTTGSLNFLPWLLSGMCGVITRGSEADLLSSMSTPQRSHLHPFYTAIPDLVAQFIMLTGYVVLHTKWWTENWETHWKPIQWVISNLSVVVSTLCMGTFTSQGH